MEKGEGREEDRIRAGFITKELDRKRQYLSIPSKSHDIIVHTFKMKSFYPNISMTLK